MATRSIYQSNGKPLSQQALYQQKLRQGVFNAPSNPSVGVNSNASDTAALLAASSDLTVKPSYERTIAQEAHSAAEAAKAGRTSTLSSTVSSASAAAAALGVQGGTGVPQYKADNVYKQASANSSYSITSRTDPSTRDFRHGLKTKNSSTSIDISKINNVASKNSSKTLNSRFNPQLDYRSGIKSEYLTDPEERLAEDGAAASMKFDGSASTLASSTQRSKSFAATDVVNSTLLAAANKAAEKRLEHLHSSQPLDFKQQARLYANALAVAQKNSDERINNHKKGLIDCGGGLMISATELDRMAAQIVKPVLDNLDTKTEEQRKLDEAAFDRHRQRVREHDKYKKEAFEKKLQEKRDIEAGKQERLKALNVKKDAKEKELKKYHQDRLAEIETLVAELKELEQKHAEEKEALLAEKKEALDKIEEEETGLKTGRKDELLSMQNEKDEEIKPTLDELEIELGKLKELTEARDTLLGEVQAGEKTKEEYTETIKELETELASINAGIEEFTAKLEEATQKHEDISKEVEELQEHTDKEVTEAENKSKDFDTKIAELESKQNEYLELKDNHKKDIQELLEERVKNEKKINDELPDHMKKDINEKKLKDTSSLFSAPETIKEATIDEAVEGKAKPEVEVGTAPATTAPKAKTTSKATPAPKATPVSQKPAPPSRKPSKTKESFKKFAKYFASTQANASRKPEVVAIQKEPATVSKKDIASETSVVDTIDEASLKKGSENKGGIFKEEI